MNTLDVGELIDNIDEVLHMVEEDGETFEITNHGEVIVHHVPVGMPQSTTEAAKRDVWSDLDRLAAGISANWPSNISAVDAVRDVRRDL